MPWARPSRTASPRAVRRRGREYGIVEDYVGHGIGTSMHMDPQVPNYRVSGKGPKVVDGTTICIEPMVALGDQDNIVLDDEWTVATRDRSRAAHWEHSVAATAAGPVRAHRRRRRRGAAAGRSVRHSPRSTPPDPAPGARRSSTGAPAGRVCGPCARVSVAGPLRAATRVDAQARDGPAPTPCTASHRPLRAGRVRGTGGRAGTAAGRRRKGSTMTDASVAQTTDHTPAGPGPAPAWRPASRSRAARTGSASSPPCSTRAAPRTPASTARGRGRPAPPPRGRPRGRRPLPARRPRPRRARRDAVHPRPRPARRDAPRGTCASCTTTRTPP